MLHLSVKSGKSAWNSLVFSLYKKTVVQSPSLGIIYNVEVKFPAGSLGS